MKNDEQTGLEFLEQPSATELSRRDFFKSAGSGIFLLFTIGDSLFAGQEGQGRPQRSLPTDFNAFLKIGQDGRVSCYVGKIEMGQGIVTSLGQMLADELDVPVDSVEMVMGDTDLCPWDNGTFGSLSTRSFGPSLRKAGAEARQVLLELGSEQLKVPVERLTTENGNVLDATNKQNKVSYAELAKGKTIERRPTGKVSVKKPGEFKVMNKSFVRRDAEQKVSGKAKYTGDIQLPGMLYARILRPPAHDSRLVSVDIAEAKQVEGVQVIKEGEFVAVLHKYPDVAEAALSKIKAKYDTPKSDLNETSIFDHLLKVAPAPKVMAQDGNLQMGEQASRTIVESTYYNDYVAHSPMEPHTAVAHVEGTKATVWASTQNPFTAREEIAEELGFPPEKVRVITPFVGGAFGGKTRNLQALEAAKLSKMTGKPVQVAYNRREEFFFDAFRPAAVVKIKSGMSDKGKLTLWDYHVYFASDRGTQMFYDVPNFSTKAYNASFVGAPGSHPFLTGAWRAPGNNTNSYAREMQIDIMAEKAGMDPIEFRMQNITNKKMRGVLKAAADKFGWKSGKSPSGRGLGVACGADAGTFVASIAEVAVDKSTGAVRVKRVVCAQDMGLVINPEGATIQMEGCIMMGLGYALTERVMFRGAEILNQNFDSYEIPRFSWMPKIETVIIDDKGADPQGGGEPAIIIMGSLIANAIYDAVGTRVYQLPVTPERIKEALKKI